ncbi:hypothetical protein SLE2022_364060 [Rubroshorea leprosula]
MKKEGVIAIASTAAATVVTVAELFRHWRRRRERQWKQTQLILRKFAGECATPVPKLWEVADAMVADMQSSLANSLETSSRSTLSMLVSYVASLPPGDEKGMYYGLNLRGTTFLILCARLKGKNDTISDLHREEISVPSNVMHGTSKEMNDYIAMEVATFILAHLDNCNEETAIKKNLGITMSYPVDPQGGTTSWSAIRWKCFSADDPTGKEIVDEINKALEKHWVEMRVYALVDDTIGDLAGGKYYSRDCVAEVSLGMGTNATYVDTPHSVPGWQWHGPLPKSGETVISTEWGNFNSSHLPITEFDTSLDAESSDPGIQIFERLVSGMYLGEIARRVLLKMAQETALFGDSVPPNLMIPYQLRSPNMAAMHQDTLENHEIIHETLKEVFGITNSTPMMREIVVEVCDIVTKRGARLVGTGIVAIMKKLGRIKGRRSMVTVGGGLYEHYRVFRNDLHSSVWEMLGNQLSENAIIENSHGGSGAGALFFATSQTQESQQDS